MKTSLFTIAKKLVRRAQEIDRRIWAGIDDDVNDQIAFLSTLRLDMRQVGQVWSVVIRRPSSIFKTL